MKLGVERLGLLSYLCDLDVGIFISLCFIDSSIIGKDINTNKGVLARLALLAISGAIRELP